MQEQGWDREDGVAGNGKVNEEMFSVLTGAIT